MFFLTLFITSELRNLSLGMTKLSVQDAVLKLNAGNMKVIDVRDQESFKEGHLDKAVNIPLKDLEKNITKLSKLKKKAILVTCNTGHISVGAGTILRKNGFDDLYLLKGGVNAWSEAHMPLFK